jgi:hypothetical protein
LPGFLGRSPGLVPKSPGESARVKCPTLGPGVIGAVGGRLTRAGESGGEGGGRHGALVVVPGRGLRSGVGGGSSHRFGRAVWTRVSSAPGRSIKTGGRPVHVCGGDTDAGASSPWLAPRALLLSASLLAWGHAASTRFSVAGCLVRHRISPSPRP